MLEFRFMIKRGAFRLSPNAPCLAVGRADPCHVADTHGPLLAHCETGCR